MNWNTTSEPLMSWKFNKNYKDWKQVEHLWDSYMEIWTELKEQGQFPYNSCFEGKIDGLKDSEDESTGIYLLQGLRQSKDHEEKIQAFIDDESLRELNEDEIPEDGTKVKFNRIVAFTQPVEGDNAGNKLIVREKARLSVVDNHYGKGLFLYPKGKRNRGFHLGEFRVNSASRTYTVLVE